MNKTKETGICYNCKRLGFDIVVLMVIVVKQVI